MAYLETRWITMESKDSAILFAGNHCGAPPIAGLHPRSTKILGWKSVSLLDYYAHRLMRERRRKQFGEPPTLNQSMDIIRRQKQRQ